MPYKRAGIAFSIYDGDIKDGCSKRTDEVYTEALQTLGQSPWSVQRQETAGTRRGAGGQSDRGHR